MEKRSGEETSDLRPGRIDSKGAAHLKNLAKRIKKQEGLRMSEALEHVAQSHGFKNWNNVLRYASKRPRSDHQYHGGIRNRLMFFEIKPTENVFERGYVMGEAFRPIQDVLRVNLLAANKIEFSSGFVVRDSLGYWDISKEKATDTTSGDSLHGKALNEKCRIIRLWYRYTDFEEEAHEYIFFDEGEYHRAKRQVDDVCAGKA